MLDNSFFVAVVIAVAAVLSAWRVLAEVRRTRRSLIVRSGLALLTAAGVLLAVAAVVNHHYSYLPDVGSLTGHVSPDLTRTTRYLADAPSPLHGVIEKQVLAGPGFSAKPLYVYLPAPYFKDLASRFPVLYLLHGSPGIAVDWIRTGKIDRTMDTLVAQNAIRPFIIVMPDFDLNYARDTQCEDIPAGPQMDTYLTRDVVSFVDTHYRTIADRDDRVIGGFSAGAYCGINLTMRHQGVFSAFVSDSGYTVPDENTYTRDLFGGSEWLRRSNTPADYLWSIPMREPLGAYLEAGSADPVFRDDSAWVTSVLRRRGASVTLRIFPGHDHGWRDARDHATYLLRWTSSWFANTSASANAHTPAVSSVRSTSPSI